MKTFFGNGNDIMYFFVLKRTKLLIRYMDRELIFDYVRNDF